MGRSLTGSMKPPMRNTGANLSNTSSTPPHHYQNAQQPGGPSHPGKRIELPTTANPPPPITATRKTTTRATMTTNWTMNTIPPLHHHNEYYPQVNLRQTAPLPPPNTNQKDGRTTQFFVPKSDEACLTHLRFLDSDLEHLRLKSRSITDNSSANIIQTRMTLPSLALMQLKPLTSSSFSTTCRNTSRNMHKKQENEPVTTIKDSPLLTSNKILSHSLFCT